LSRSHDAHRRSALHAALLHVTLVLQGTIVEHWFLGYANLM